jgi:hypothetical protein
MRPKPLGVFVRACKKKPMRARKGLQARIKRRSDLSSTRGDKRGHVHRQLWDNLQVQTDELMEFPSATQRTS